MKILMFGMSSYPGGIENYIANYFLNETFAKEAMIDFVTYEGNLAYEDRISILGYCVKRVPHLKRHPFGYMRSVKKLLKAGAYDCVYVNMLSAANVLPVKYAVKAGIGKIVVHAHANSTVKGALRKILHKWNKKYCIRHATHKLACSKEAGEWLFGESDVTVMPNAISSDRFAFSGIHRAEIRQTLGIKEETFVVGHVGRFAEEKNHGFILEVFEEIAKKRDDARLLLVGDGGRKQSVEEKAKTLKSAGKILFAGTSAQTEKYYSAFDCFLFPSTFEGFGMAALEAQANGLKCYCSDCLSKELNVTDTLSYLPLSKGAAFWASEILSSVQRLAENNEKVAKSDYEIEKQIKKILDILR